MAIDFTFPPEVEQARLEVRRFMDEVVRPREAGVELSFDKRDRNQLISAIAELRRDAMQAGLWLPQMPKEWGGMGLGPTAIAAVSAECAKTTLGSFALGCQAPDEGNMHTLLHFGTDAQKKKFLEPMTQGWGRSCFAMTEPEVSGSDPTLIQTHARLEGDEWVINGHKWFISGAKGAHFAIVIAKTEPEADNPRHRTSAIIVPTDTPGFRLVRDISTMGGSHNHCEILLEDCRVPADNLLGERGGGHRLGQVRLGPARLAHCMRWIGQVEIALELMIDRATKRFTHGSLLSDKQAIQWMIADSGMELYAAKLMVLHAAYKIESGLPFRTEVSYAKHHVANTLWRVIDRAMQVHGALGYSNDSPLAKMMTNARWARFADGADEVHQMKIAQALIASYAASGSVNEATGALPL
jgi:acyl-CoA dehydrogenase